MSKNMDTIYKYHFSNYKLYVLFYRRYFILHWIAGVDKIEADEGKGTLTVTGDADPYEIIVRIRKAGKHAEVVSIGPPKPDAQKQPEEKKPEEKKKAEEKKKPEEKKPDPVILDQIPQVPYMQMPPHYYPHYQPVVVHMSSWDEPNPSCSILWLWTENATDPKKN